MDIEEIKEKKENLIKLYLTDSNKPKKYWVNLSVYNNQIIEELTKENENNEKTLTTWMKMEQKLQNENKELKEALKSTRMLNLHLYDKGTVGNKVYEKIKQLLNKN